MHNRYHWGIGVAYLTYLFYFNSKNIYDIHNTVSFAWKKQTYNGKNVAVGLKTFVWGGVLHLLRRLCHRHLLEFDFKLG